MDRTLQLLIQIALKNQQGLQGLIDQLEQVQKLSKVDVEVQSKGNAGVAKSAQAAQDATKGLGKAAKDANKAIADGGEESQISFTELAGSVFLVQQAIATLVGVAQPAYGALIGANEELNQQLLKSAATITATSRVYQGGELLIDPTETIKTLQGPLLQAIKDVEIATRDLVGVTSQDVNTAFSSVLQNISQLNGQLADSATGAQKFATPIEAATALAPGLVATLGTLGLPLEQAADEINNLLKGEIDQTAQLAKSLNISREQIETWKEQGNLVDQLIKRFDPFVEANALAARSVAGLTSNIQDIVEVIARTSGEPLLEPFVRALELTYQLLQQNQDAIQQFFQQAIKIAIQAGEAVVKAFTPLVESLVSVAGDSGPIALSVLEAIAFAIQLAATAAGPFLTIIGKVLEALTKLAATDLGGLLIQTALITAGLAAIATTITGSVIPALLAMVPAAATAAAGALAALGPLLIPLAALAGGVAVIITVRKAKALEDAQDALDSLRGATNQLADESLNLASKLKTLNDIEASGGKLTEEQAERRRRLSAIATQNVGAINDQIAALKELTPASEAQATQIQLQIGLLEQRKDLLGRQAEGLRIEGRALERLGTSYEQLEKKVKAANEAIRQEGSGDKDRFDDQIQQLQEFTQRQVELGQISEEVAIARLEGIRDNEKAGFEIQLSASEAIEQLRQQQLDREQARADAEIKLIEARTQGNLEAERKAAEEVAKLRSDQLEERIKSTTEAIAREQAEIDKGFGSREELERLLNEEKELSAQRVDQQNEAAQRITDIEKREAEQREAIIENQLARIQLAADQGNKTRVEAAEDTTRKQREQLQAQLKDLEESIARQRELLADGAGDEGELASLLAQQEQLQIRQERQALESAQTISDARIAETERQNIAIAKSEADTQLRIANLKEQGTTRAIQLQQDELEATIKRTQEQIKLEEQKLTQLRQGPQTRDNLDAIAQQEIEVTKLQAQFADQRRELREQAIEAEVAAVERKTIAIETAEVDAETNITKLRESGAASAIQLEQDQLDASLKRINLEIEKEKEKLAVLEQKPQNQDTLDEIAQQQNAIRRLENQAANERIAIREKAIEAEIAAVERKAIAIETTEVDAEREAARVREEGTTAAIQQEQDQLNATLDRINAELAKEQEKLEVLRQKPQNQDTLDEIAQQQNAITRLETQAAEQRVAIREKALQADLEAIDRRRIAIEKSEAETALRIAQLRDAGTSDQIDRDRQQLESSLDRIEKELQAEQDKLTRLRQQPQNQDTLDEIERQETEVIRLQTQLIDERLQLEEQAEQAALQILERSQQEAIALIEEAEAERTLILAQREANLRARGVAEEEIERDSAQKSLELQRTNLSSRLDAQRQFLAELEALPQPDDPDRAREREQQIRSAKVETARIATQLLQTQEDLQKQLTQTILTEIDKEQSARERAAKAITDSLSREQQLLDARTGLAASVVRVEEARLRNQAASTDDAVKRSRIELQIAKIQERALAQRQRAERLSLELTQKRALIENQIAIASAKAELAKARARGATQDELDALQQVLTETTALRGTLEETQRIERETLANNQEADRIGATGSVDAAERAVTEAIKAGAEQAERDLESESGRERNPRLGQTTVNYNSNVRGPGARRGSRGRDRSRGFDTSGNALSEEQAAAELQKTQQEELEERQKLNDELESEREARAQLNLNLEETPGNVLNLGEASNQAADAGRTLAEAASQAAARLSAIPAIAARKDGGPTEKGGIYSIAELMPELFLTKNGAYLVTEPQVFKADQDGYVLDGNTTKQILGRGYNPIYASGNGGGSGSGGESLLFEMRQLRYIIQSRPPVSVGGDTINISPNDLPRALDYQAMRQRAAVRAGGLG